MLFHEIYGCYYQSVHKMIELALEHKLTEEKMLEIIHKYAFQESPLHIIPAIKDENWQVITQSLQTPLQHSPTMPLTILEKRWLKSMSLDPRFKLFSIQFPHIDEEPLFTLEDYKIYDQYADGDPYDDKTYQKHFHLLLKAIENKRKVLISYLNKDIVCIPYQIEYSLKNDKFRLLTLDNRFHKTLNISKIKSIELLDTFSDIFHFPKQHLQNYLTIELFDERNCLDRVMTHFADMQKNAEQIDDKKYKITIFYQSDDETEVLIRILSFGPYVKVIGPESFVNLFKERLTQQKSCGLR
ncbi:WYL domain-containing protein [Candidatus Stoquefichus sp. SB1]|uniref:WYL domain-containing protein n=1 Tax=Candidatus Stoquefichus sp. SB1 TaxID=1658109 RepID=UPI00067EB427|nr:WYL domain-containing protein [Candidatus Stoquefichus sp. SB1]